MGFYPLPFLTLTLCPQVGWGAECSPGGRDCPCGGHCRPYRPARELARAGSDRRPLEHLAQAFYTLQCNFFILFYSDYDYSGILSLR